VKDSRIRIRPVLDCDVVQYYELAQQYDPALGRGDIALQFGRFRSGKSYGRVAYVEDEAFRQGYDLVGFMNCEIRQLSMNHRNTLYVSDLYVAPDFRRKGIASQLMKDANDIAKHEGCELLQWVTHEYNQARHLYDAIGTSDFVLYIAGVE
jgi:GNAT superfamily N-acetyltransferase